MSYATNCSEEEFAKISDMLPNPPHMETSVFRPWSYPTSPSITMKVVERVQRMDWECVANISMEGVAQPEQDRFYAIMDAAKERFNDTTLRIRAVMHGIVTVGDAMPHMDATFRATGHFRRVIMPTQQYLEEARDKNREGYLEDIRQRQILFVEVCVDGSKKVGMKEHIRLSEDFVLCEALDGKWSNEVRHKCTCPWFFRCAQCEHVVVLAMLSDPTKTLLPAKNDIRKIRQRAGKKRGRPATEGDSHEVEEPRKKPKKKPAVKEVKLKDGVLTDSEESAPEVSHILQCPA